MPTFQYQISTTFILTTTQIIYPVVNVDRDPVCFCSKRTYCQHFKYPKPCICLYICLYALTFHLSKCQLSRFQCLQNFTAWLPSSKRQQNCYVPLHLVTLFGISVIFLKACMDLLQLISQSHSLSILTG